MGWGILGDAWDSVSGAVSDSVEWIGEKAEGAYKTGKKFVEEHADTISDVAGVVGDVSTFLASGAVLVPGVGTAVAAGLAGIGAAGKGVEALAKGAKGVSKAIDATDKAIDKIRQDDWEGAFGAAKEGIAAGKGVAGAATTIAKPFKKPSKEEVLKEEQEEKKRKEIERKQQSKKPKEKDAELRKDLFAEYR
tara:strand:- start:1703 stop:2278 length:576 start_codon:yes stop_codon:yes gene_type:complete